MFAHGREPQANFSFYKAESEPVELMDESELCPRRDAEARRVASRMSLGQDDVVGVKIAIRAASASECLSSCRISSNRSAEDEENK